MVYYAIYKTVFLPVSYCVTSVSPKFRFLFHFTELFAFLFSSRVSVYVNEEAFQCSRVFE